MDKAPMSSDRSVDLGLTFDVCKESRDQDNQGYNIVHFYKAEGAIGRGTASAQRETYPLAKSQDQSNFPLPFPAGKNPTRSRSLGFTNKTN